MKKQKGKDRMQKSRKEGNMLNPWYNIEWNTGGWEQDQIKVVLYVGAKNKR